MSCENTRPTNEAADTARCGCAKNRDGQSCPCKKRVCLPILGLLGVAVLVSLAARARKSRCAGCGSSEYNRPRINDSRREFFDAAAGCCSR